MSSVLSQGNMISQSTGGMEASADALTNQLAGMSKHQLYQIVSQMKELIHQNRAQAREILIANPQLTKALFQAQLMLGMVRVPETSPLPSAPAPSQQQSVTQSQPPQTSVAPQPPHVMSQSSSVQQPQHQQVISQKPSPPQVPVQQPSLQQVPAAVVQPSQPFPFQQPSQSPPVQGVPVQANQSVFSVQQTLQAHQQSNIRSGMMPPHSQSASSSLQPPLQHAQPQPPLPLQPPPLPQQPRQMAPPSQMQHQMSQGMGFHPPPGPQSYHSQPPYQQQGAPQTNMGIPYQQMHPPLTNQPMPPQHMYQASRGPGIGASAPMPTWNQPMQSSGPVPQNTGNAPMGGGHMLPAHHPYVAVGGPVPGPNMNHSQGYGQHMTQTQVQPQLHHQHQMSMDVEQQHKALLQQVMNLTHEQIQSLPPEQRQQVLQLQQAFRNQAG